MIFQNFQLEHYQSEHERKVDFNLADSSVKCTGVSDWLAADEIQELLDTGLFYPEVNGTAALRQRVAGLYPAGVGIENVLVTVGAAQATGMICATLLEPGDEVVVISPGYRQVWGLALNSGCVVRELNTRPENDWRPDLDELAALIGPKTRMVSIVNPNNPTGAVLTGAEMAGIVAICSRAGCWLHADEVYAGTELHGAPATTFWGRYDKVICTNSMSKAYGLSGLRIGWIVASQQMIDAFWRRHEYAVIAAASPSMTLAEIALRPEKREWLLQRQRRLSSEGRAVLEEWLPQQQGRFSWRRSAATPVAFLRYHFDMPSLTLAEKIRQQASVLVAPGSYLGAEGCLRVTVGYDAEKIAKALARITEVTGKLVA
jgi:aspartate/methionine/tyrosine aminotransferase